MWWALCIYMHDFQKKLWYKNLGCFQVMTIHPPIMVIVF